MQARGDAVTFLTVRRAAAFALYFVALAQAVLSGVALHSLWRELVGLDPVTTYAWLPFLILGFPWIFVAALFPGEFGQLTGTALGATINFALICLAARRVGRERPAAR